MTIYLNSLDEADGKEVFPGIWLIGKPTLHDGEWRCLANAGALVVVSLDITQGTPDEQKAKP